MPSSSETIEKQISQEYKWGFVTDIEADAVPPGLSEDVVRLISAKKNEPEWLLEWRLKAYRHWLKMVEPRWAMVNYPEIDYQDIVYYSAPKKAEDAPKSLDEVDPELLKTYEKLGIPLAEQELLAGVAVDAVFDSVSVATTFREKLAELGHRLLLVLRGGAGASRPGQEVAGFGRPVLGQLLRDAELRGVQRRFVRLHPQGRALPDGAEHVLPDQRGKHRAVRAHADRRRRGRLRQLSRGLHRADARREPAPRRRGRTGRAGRRPDQVLDRAELVSRATRTARAGSTTS